MDRIILDIVTVDTGSVGADVEAAIRAAIREHFAAGGVFTWGERQAMCALTRRIAREEWVGRVAPADSDAAAAEADADYLGADALRDIAALGREEVATWTR